MSLQAGIQLGPYKILSSLGAGGMGEVYRARDTRLDRDVAVKVLPQKLADNSNALARFEREAKALAVLSHPNILTIFDVGKDHGLSYVVMELLQGETLRTRLREGPLSWQRGVEISIAIAEGLAAAHSKGVIHRDLKPENIFLTSDGVLKILDFGLARFDNVLSAEEATAAPTVGSPTEPGVILGTVNYMSPEQVRAIPADARSDLFSFGTILYEMVNGNRPFNGTGAGEIMASILKDEPQPISQSIKDIPADLSGIIQHCLEKRPEDRFQSARDLVFQLKSVLSGSSIAAPFPKRLEFRLPKTVLISAILSALLIAISVYFFLPRPQKMSSIAILPFENVAKDPNAEYLSDGITESLIDSMSSLPKLRVMAHDTVFSYKGKSIDPRKVGHDLSVDAIVTGRVLHQGDTLVIRANLVRVADGAELWGQQFNRKLADVLAIQDEISREISNNLKLKLSGQEQKRLTKHYTEDPEAYQLYLKGRYFLLKYTPENYQKALEYFKNAVDKDPTYALAYSGIAETYGSLGLQGLIPPGEAKQKIEAVSRKALELDESLGQAHLILGPLKFLWLWDWKGAEPEYKRTLELIPNWETPHRYYSLFLRAVGRFPEAIRENKKAVELDPLSVDTIKTLGTTYFWAKQYDQAIEQYRKALEMDPNFAEIHDLLADAYARKQMYSEAAAEEEKYLKLAGEEEGEQAFRQDFEKDGYQKAKHIQAQDNLEMLMQASQQQYVSPISIAIQYAALNNKDQAFVWLEKAYQERSPWLANLKTDPQFENLRSDPRFSELLRRMNFPQ